MENLIKTLEGIEGKEGKFYWIKALVKLGDITQGQAGYLTFYFRKEV
jgi:hypothetical protein